MCVSVSIAVRATIHVSHQGGDGEDTCTYNGVQVNDYSAIDGNILSGVFSCEGGP